MGLFITRKLGILLVLTAVLADFSSASEPASGTSLKRDLALAECILLAVQNNRDLATGPIGAGSLLISTKKWKSLLISHTGLVFSR